MSNLAEENTKLKTENEELKRELVRLKEENTNLRKSFYTIRLKTIKYSEENRPTLYINDFKIYFESANDKAAQLAKIICRPEVIKDFKYNPISTEDIYELNQYSEDWFNISSRERKNYEQRIYQAFRLLNDKIAPYVGDHRLFKKENGKYSFNKFLKIVY